MSVFDSQYAEQYDLLYAHKNYVEECNLVEAAVGRFAARRPASILDVGCGTGQHAIELASRGYQVAGVDLSESMLRLARSHADRLSLAQRPEWVRGDARKFDLDRQFDLAIMMFAVVGYLTTNQDVTLGLRNIRRHLNPGALFACDFWHGPAVLSDRPTDRIRVVSTDSGEVIRSTRTALDIATHTADVQFQLWQIANERVANKSVETHKMRFFFPQEFALFLSTAGFEMLNISAFPTLDSPISDKAWNAFVVARAV